MAVASQNAQQYSQLMDLAGYYQYYLFGNCAYIGALYPLCCYLLFGRDIKLKKAYKYMLFMCATTTLMNAVLYALWAPITSQSFMGGFSYGVAANLGYTANIYIFQLSLVVLTNSQVATILLLVFQYAHLSPKAFLSRFGRTEKRLIVTYICYTLFLFTVSFLVMFSVNDKAEFAAYIGRRNDTYAQLLVTKQPTLISFVAELNPVVYLLGVLEIASPVLLFSLGFYYTCVLYKIITSTKGSVSHNTFKREMMMFRTFVFKTMMMLVFYVIPILGYTICLWLEVKNPVCGLVLNIILVSHGWPSYIGSVWLIKPYRVMVLRMVGDRIGLQIYQTDAVTSMRPSSTAQQQQLSNSQNPAVSKENRVFPTL